MGKLFVIDGTDGSGKQTQFNKLKERFDKENIEYKVASFPNYDHRSSSLVKMYLSGEFGENAKDVLRVITQIKVMLLQVALFVVLDIIVL